jgi:hypothetical protein
MSQYIGIVKSIPGEGEAEVLIRPEHPGILGAPNLDVCHRASNGSSVTVMAINRVSAQKDDLISLSRKAGSPMKNAGALFGIPLVGLGLGLLAGISLWESYDISLLALLLLASVGIFAGAFFGVFLYRRISGNAPLLITGVIRRGNPLQKVRFCEEQATACELCTGKNPDS